jgi:hypothetical protein
MIFEIANNIEQLKLLWQEDNYSSSDTEPYDVANLVGCQYFLEKDEIFDREKIFANFLVFTQLQMVNPFVNSFCYELLDAETAFYEICHHLQSGQCCEIAVFESDSVRSEQFTRLFKQTVTADTFFYRVPNPSIATRLYTNQACIVWINTETVGTLFFLGYD